MSWEAKAWRRWPDAWHVKGSGPVAVVTSFDGVGAAATVTLCPDLEEAVRYRDHVDRQMRRLRKSTHGFEIVDLREEVEL
jgi:hypothetical protein